MLTNGFSCPLSGSVTLDTYFVTPNLHSVIASTVISVGTAAGGIVYLNPNLEPQWWPNASLGYNPIAAVQILTSATIDSVLRTTTATGLGWHATRFPL